MLERSRSSACVAVACRMRSSAVSSDVSLFLLPIRPSHHFLPIRSPRYDNRLSGQERAPHISFRSGESYSGKAIRNPADSRHRKTVSLVSRALAVVCRAVAPCARNRGFKRHATRRNANCADTTRPKGPLLG